ncbi:hypothetical protein ACFQE0_27370 [Methylobacterium komagatae]|uniref:Uncharacterized protein n=1 Tax=Methylobacterium komagatae TaxID=374425 RepID=A0ABW2BRT2_9HYPH
MARKTSNTRPIHAQGGPVTRAIAAVRQPTAPWFVTLEPDDLITSGYHLGRRRDWDDQGREEIVFLLVDHDEAGWMWSVWRCGGGKPENPEEWEFTLRLGGIRSMPADPLDLSATVH